MRLFLLSNTKQFDTYLDAYYIYVVHVHVNVCKFDLINMESNDLCHLNTLLVEHCPVPVRTISSAGRPLLQQSTAQQHLTSLSGK